MIQLVNVKSKLKTQISPDSQGPTIISMEACINKVKTLNGSKGTCDLHVVLLLVWGLYL